jgi:hypothetical protein
MVLLVVAAFRGVVPGQTAVLLAGEAIVGHGRIVAGAGFAPAT